MLKRIFLFNKQLGYSESNGVPLLTAQQGFMRGVPSWQMLPSKTTDQDTHVDIRINLTFRKPPATFFPGHLQNEIFSTVLSV